MFIAIEKSTEEEAFELKLNKTMEVNASIDYMKANFWRLANSMNNSFSFQARVINNLIMFL